MEDNWSTLLKLAGPLFAFMAALIAAAITKKYQKGNLLLAHEDMEKKLFTEFNQRYDELNDSLSLLSSNMDLDTLKKTDSLIEKKTLYNVLIDYFNLCAEQYYWKNKGRVSVEIWEAWHSGMCYYYNKYPVVRELWKKEIEGDGYKSYYLKYKPYYSSKDVRFFV